MFSRSDPTRGLPLSTEYVRIPVTGAALDGPAWPESALGALADALPFLRAVVLDCRTVGRFEKSGVAAMDQLLRTMSAHRCRVLVIPPARASFRAVWASSGATLRFPAPTEAQLARTLDLPSGEDEHQTADIA